ncbi:MFS transporter [Alphaproteobacteria bacterium]|nr:MFS transporter [Alphaproteobacteria bacterium]
MIVRPAVIPSDLSIAAIKDSRKGWAVVCILFLMLGVVMGGRNSIGLMMPFWKDDLGWSYGLVATAGAIMLTVMAVVAPAAGLVLDRLGARAVYATGMSFIGTAFILCSFMTEPWQLIALFSIMGGMGFAVVSPSLVSSTVARYFESRLGLATSIASSGSTGGQLALMPLLGAVVVAIGWRPSFIAMGVTILATAIIVPIMIGKEPQNASSGRTATGWALASTFNQLRRNRTFWLLISGFFICGYTTVGVIKIHLIPYAVSCGFPPLQSAVAYGVMSFFSMAGMILYGYLADRLHRPGLLASIYVMRALSFILLMHIAGSPAMLFVFAILFGIFDYSTFPIVASLVASHIGRHIMGVTMGLIFGAHSLGAALGSFMGGYLFDLFARYDWVWTTSIGLALVAALLTILIRENRTPVKEPTVA